MEEAYFENIKPIITERLLLAEKSIKVISAYFSNAGLFDTLCLCAKKGLDVQLIISDEPQNTYESKINFAKLVDSNGRFYLANRSPYKSLVHHKFCLVDDEMVLTGSYNWTEKACTNRENLIITNNKEVVGRYLQEFKFIKEEYSKPFDKWDEIAVPSGFSAIDEIIDSFKPSELICLTGKQGIGKTSFLLRGAAPF